MEGGTEVAIFGSGFARAGLDGTTTVLIGNVKCDVSEYKSNDNKVNTWRRL